MQFKLVQNKFLEAIKKIYGVVKETKAAITRLNTPINARPGTFEAAIKASVSRDIRRSNRTAARKNTRGLPLGYSVHEARRARLLMRSMKARESATDSQLEAAQQFYEDQQRTNDLRAQIARKRPRKGLKYVLTSWRRKSVQYIAAQVRAKLQRASQAGLTPYRLQPGDKRLTRQERKRTRLIAGRVRELGGGAIEVTPA